jgi:hypothetical protein
VSGDATEAPAKHGFCARHRCGSGFHDGSGSIVQCSDGVWSHSGGNHGAYSDHGGVGWPGGRYGVVSPAASAMTLTSEWD